MPTTAPNRPRKRRIFPRIIALFALGTLMYPASEASAHASLIGSEPAYAATLTASPTEFRLLFDNLVEPGLVKVRLKDEAGTEIGKGTLVGERTPRADVSFTLPSHASGNWVVYWTSFAFDGHVVSGSVPYTVDPNAENTASAGTTSGQTSTDSVGATAQAPDAGSTNQLIDIIDIQLRFLSYLAIAVLFGAAVWQSLLRNMVRGDGAAGVLFRAAESALPIAAAAAAGAALLRGSVAAWRYLYGGIAVEDLLPLFHNGQLGVYPLAAALFGVAAWRSDALVRLGSAVAAVGLLVSVGHVATAPAPGVGTILMTAHLVAAAVWVGVIGVLAYTATDRRFHEDGERWAILRTPLAQCSGLLIGAVATLIVTGARAATVYTDTPFDGRWGLTLLAKLALVAGAGVIGLYHTIVVRRGGRLTRSTLSIEAVLLVLTLTAAAVLSVSNY